MDNWPIQETDPETEVHHHLPYPVKFRRPCELGKMKLGSIRANKIRISIGTRPVKKNLSKSELTHGRYSLPG